MAKKTKANDGPADAPETSGQNDGPADAMETLDQAVHQEIACIAAGNAEGSTPSFVLRAGRPGHTRALRVAIQELGPPDSIDARAALEAFKRFEKKA